MPVPQNPAARKYFRAPGQRCEDAEFLLQAGRMLGAVYLAGYCVECLLKALILCQVPAGKREQVREQFRGGKAHDFVWLRDMYRVHKGPNLPPDVVEAFSEVAIWDTDLRYEPGTVADDDAIAFLRAAEVIRVWADGRMS